MYPVISIFSLQIPSYWLVSSLSFCIALLYLNFRAQRFSFARALVLDSALVVLVSGFVGARLLHIVYEEPTYYLENLWRIFYFWQGGYVFFGGALLAFLSVYGWAKRQALSFSHLLDLYAPVVILGYGLGRIACLLAGCCHGRACDLAWAIRYPAGVEAPAGLALHPAPIYASLWASAHFFVLLFLEARYSPRNNSQYSLAPGQLFYFALLMHGVGRIVMEYFRGDPRGDRILGLSLSTWIAFALVFVAARKLRPRPCTDEETM